LDPESCKLKICMVGDEGVGKTSLVRSFAGEAFDDAYKRTLGTAVTKVDLGQVGERLRATLMIWDIMGDKQFFRLCKDAYFNHVGGILAVFDLTKFETLLSLYEWIDGIDDMRRRVPVVVLANKADLREGIKVDEDKVERLCNEASCSWLRTSAKNGENVQKAFLDLTQLVVHLPFGTSTLHSRPRD